MAPAAFQATFSNLRTVNGRKVLQLIFEIPIEQSNQALEILGGVPDPSKSIWCAIARLQETKPEQPQREKKRWEDMTAAQQAGVLCNDPTFTKFLQEHHGIQDDDAAGFVRGYCVVNSRKDIGKEPFSLKAWETLVGDYRAWQHEPEYV